MAYPLKTAHTGRKLRESRRLRQARWQLQEQARLIDELLRRLGEK